MTNITVGVAATVGCMQSLLLMAELLLMLLLLTLLLPERGPEVLNQAGRDGALVTHAGQEGGDPRFLVRNLSRRTGLRSWQARRWMRFQPLLCLDPLSTSARNVGGPMMLLHPKRPGWQGARQRGAAAHAPPQEGRVMSLMLLLLCHPQRRHLQRTSRRGRVMSLLLLLCRPQRRRLQGARRSGAAAALCREGRAIGLLLLLLRRPQRRSRRFPLPQDVPEDILADRTRALGSESEQLVQHRITFGRGPTAIQMMGQVIQGPRPRPQIIAQDLLLLQLLPQLGQGIIPRFQALVV